MLFEEKLIFCPTRFPDGNWEPTVPPGYELENIFFESDGLRLHGWYLKPDKLRHNTAVLLCHGNAGNISTRFDKALSICSLGVPVFLYDYRGYGRSEDAFVSEEGVYADSLAAWDWLSQKGFKSIVIHGISLGGGVALYLALNRQPEALSLESTFTSLPDMSKEVYPFIPRFLISSSFNNLERIKDLKIPLQIIHGTADELIPFRMGQELFDAAQCSKKLITIEGAGHSDLLSVAGEDFAKHFEDILQRSLSED